MERKIKGTRLLLKQGDITREDTEAIVNAANPMLMGGGGVDGAIHKAGGEVILKDCKRIFIAAGPLPIGQAVITRAGNLKARSVIHTVGPIWAGGEQGEDALLAKCYQSCLDLAWKTGLRTIAFPSVSTGAYGYPVDRAAGIALSSVIGFIRKRTKARIKSRKLAGVHFVLFSEDDLEIYGRALAEIS